MTRGLPGSGKSTWAKEEVAKSKGTIKRINKDDLRAMIDGKWTRDKEKAIIEARNGMIAVFLRSGLSVIVDDTNFHKEHQSTLEMIADFNNVEFEIKDFSDVPPHICIDRDEKRPNSVGRKVIYDMYKQYLCSKQVIDEDKPYCVIIDIDGTLAHMSGRSPYDIEKVSTDTLDQDIKDLYEMIPEHIDVVIMSGRSSEAREATEEWLEKHGINYDMLLMRAKDDVRKDYIVKKELYEKGVKKFYNVLFAIDDRQQVVDMWRAQGIKCLQVDYGLF